MGEGQGEEQGGVAHPFLARLKAGHELSLQAPTEPCLN